MAKRAVGWVMTFTVFFAADAQSAPAPRVVHLKATDGVELTATFFGAGKPGAGVLLLPRSMCSSSISWRIRILPMQTTPWLALTSPMGRRLWHGNTLRRP